MEPVLLSVVEPEKLSVEAQSTPAIPSQQLIDIDFFPLPATPIYFQITVLAHELSLIPKMVMDPFEVLLNEPLMSLEQILAPELVSIPQAGKIDELAVDLEPLLLIKPILVSKYIPNLQPVYFFDPGLIPEPAFLPESILTLESVIHTESISIPELTQFYEPEWFIEPISVSELTLVPDLVITFEQALIPEPVSALQQKDVEKSEILVNSIKGDQPLPFVNQNSLADEKIDKLMVDIAPDASEIRDFDIEEKDEYKNNETFDPSTISAEYFDSTKTDVQALILMLNDIIRRRDYNSWESFLSDYYKLKISDVSFLEIVSQSSILRRQNVKLKGLKDYFLYVVVPSRANDRVDDIEFFGQNRVKAYTLNKNGQRLRLYDLEKTENGWKIIN